MKKKFEFYFFIEDYFLFVGFILEFFFGVVVIFFLFLVGGVCFFELLFFVVFDERFFVFVFNMVICNIKR